MSLKKHHILPFALLTLLLFTTCKKEEFVDPVPKIEIQSVSPTTVAEFQDEVIVKLAYEDQDGDVGHWDADSLLLFVKDSRLSEPDLYHIPSVSPDGDSLNVFGTISVELTAPFLLGNGGSESITYSIWMRDRGGNYSNTVETETITITP